MKTVFQRAMVLGVALLLLGCSAGPAGTQLQPLSTPAQTEPAAGSPVAPRPTPLTAGNPAPPAAPVKLIFIHHSSGGNWLADPENNSLGGGLGQALLENNYYASATNYGWGPRKIGDRTDLGHWWDWFRSDQSSTYLEALYEETGQNIGDGDWPRLPADPGGENQIILFKSCFPNSNLGGSPEDPATTGDNPMRGAWAGDDSYTLGNAKGIYNDILEYFATRQDKLFIAITAPPLADFDTSPAAAANARAFNDWLVNDWLADYPYNNVAVFDFYNVLTSNGGSPDTNDLGTEAGNHHRWWNGAIQHQQAAQNNFSAYPSGDSHPSQAGNQKATVEFIELLNVYYNRWVGDL